MRRVPALLAAVTFLLASAVAAIAADPGSDSRTIIQNQISAFLDDDAATAYSYASPAIQGLFPDKDKFFAMVKKSYQPVYRPGNYAFGRNKIVDGGAMIMQEVMITGQEGKDWSAVYQMQRQPDGSYKINGVQMLRNTESTGI